MNTDNFGSVVRTGFRDMFLKINHGKSKNEEFFFLPKTVFHIKSDKIHVSSLVETPLVEIKFFDMTGVESYCVYLELSIDDFWKQIEEQEKKQ